MIKSESKDDLLEKVATFSTFGALETGGITRLTLTKPDILAREELCRRCVELGCDITYDDMGNIYARREGTEDLPAISMGSHMDSVKSGGNYDGILGVLSGLSVMEHLVKHNILTRHPIVLIDFTNEEGVRYEPSLMSSGVVTNVLDEEKIKHQADTEGKVFIDELRKSNFEGSKEQRLANIGSYIELHIEQGPILEEKNAQIGVVQGIVGMSCYKISVTGESSHAGTTPMSGRKDAMLTTSKLLVDLEEQLSQLSPELVFTFGKITAYPNVHTVIPNKVEVYLEFRHRDEEILTKARAIVDNLPKEFNQCQVSTELQWKRNTVEFDKTLIESVSESCEELELTSHDMYSGAGHDAQYMATVLPTTMIFLPSKDGKSHCPEEFTSEQECIQGRDVLLHTVLAYDKKVDNNEKDH